MVNPLSDIEKKMYLALEKVLVQRLVEVTPKKTGHASGSWRIESLGNMKFKLVNDTDYIVYTEDGRAPGEIHAKPGHYLKFKKPITGSKRPGRKIPGNKAFEKDGYVYAKAVYHPGIEARHFVRDVLADQRIWDSIWEQVLKQ